jgi:hypothetical protein
MPEIGTSSSMSEDGKRSVGHRPQATASILDSTLTQLIDVHARVDFSRINGPITHGVNRSFMARSCP